MVMKSNELLDGYESTSVTSEIKRTISFLNSISTFDKHINSLIERLDSTKLEIKDISETLYDMLSSIDISEAESNKIDERINLVRQLKRKYGQTEEDVFNYLKEYELLSNSSAKVAEFQSQLEKKGKELISIAITLSKQRQIISKTFESNLLLNLKDLGMNDTLFKVEFSTPEIITADDVGIDGADSLEFLISPNIGEPLKPLSKIISGGEMSRFMLALKNIIADKDSISTMVFDEIDTGISGNIMTAVAMKMCRISRNHQVIAVTHMPSLAAMADVHFLIEKNVEEDKTITHVYPLDDEGDIKEIGRLIGGLNYSNYALPHAQEMKNWANDYKKTL